LKIGRKKRCLLITSEERSYVQHEAFKIE